MSESNTQQFAFWCIAQYYCAVDYFYRVLHRCTLLDDLVFKIVTHQ